VLCWLAVGCCCLRCCCYIYTLSNTCDMQRALCCGPRLRRRGTTAPSDHRCHSCGALRAPRPSARAGAAHGSRGRTRSSRLSACTLPYPMARGSRGRMRSPRSQKLPRVHSGVLPRPSVLHQLRGGAADLALSSLHSSAPCFRWRVPCPCQANGAWRGLLHVHTGVCSPLQQSLARVP